MTGSVVPFRSREAAAIADAISHAESLAASARLVARQAELATAQALQLVIRSLPVGSTLADARSRYIAIAEGLTSTAEEAS